MSFVIDNSVALAWCFEDEHTGPIMDLLDRAAETGAFAPSLWPLEALNGLLTAERRKRIDTRQRHRLTSMLRALPITLDSETADQAWTATVRRWNATGSACTVQPTWNLRSAEGCRSRRWTWI